MTVGDSLLSCIAAAAMKWWFRIFYLIGVAKFGRMEMDEISDSHKEYNDRVLENWRGWL